jgi:hypothetical protein
MPDPPQTKDRRFAQLVQELHDASAAGDLDLASRLRSELDTITAVIGNDHDIADNARSRARKRIIAAINRSLEKIRKHDPMLARALGDALRTRKFFSYSPDLGDSSVPPVDSAPGTATKPPRPR